MKKVLAFNGSPRKTGNTSILLSKFMEGANRNTAFSETINTHEIRLEYCKGCLRCNVLGRCSIREDEWEAIATEILAADVIVFASPVYFHHVTASMKKLIDRFRSFIHVQITETGLAHTPRHLWNKVFVLLLSMGSSDTADAQPVIELFQFMTSILGPDNKLHIILATRLAVVQQIVKTELELEALYTKMNIPTHLAACDFEKNQDILMMCYSLGNRLTKSEQVIAD
jgi:multimeric flavodoxin WrbA